MSGNCFHKQKCRKFTSHHLRFVPHRIQMRQLSICCLKSTPWEPTPLTYAPTDEAEAEAKREPELLERTQNIFDTLQTETVAQLTKNPSKERNFLKWPLWVLGPAFLLGTGMAPTLWLPISSIFLGPNIANLMSLVGLDLHLQSWSDPFPPHGPFNNSAQRPNPSPKKQGSFQLQVLEHVCINRRLCYPLGIAFWVTKEHPPTSTSSYIIHGASWSLPSLIVCSNAYGIVDVALTITRLARNSSHLRGISNTPTNEGFEA